MGSFEASRALIFVDEDFARPRMLVEQEKLQMHFPQFRMYARDGKVTSVSGELKTNHGNFYEIRVKLDPNYPYILPGVYLVNHTLELRCPHKFSRNKVCVMHQNQWSPALSLAFVVAKTAIWLSKYDVWRTTGKKRWPGREQPH